MNRLKEIQEKKELKKFAKKKSKQAAKLQKEIVTLRLAYSQQKDRNKRKYDGKLKTKVCPRCLCLCLAKFD